MGTLLTHLEGKNLSLTKGKGDICFTLSYEFFLLLFTQKSIRVILKASVQLSILRGLPLTTGCGLCHLIILVTHPVYIFHIDTILRVVNLFPTFDDTPLPPMLNFYLSTLSPFKGFFFERRIYLSRRETQTGNCRSSFRGRH